MPIRSALSSRCRGAGREFVGLPEAQINLAQGTTLSGDPTQGQCLLYRRSWRRLQDAKELEAISGFLCICGMPSRPSCAILGMGRATGMCTTIRRPQTSQAHLPEALKGTQVLQAKGRN